MAAEIVGVAGSIANLVTLTAQVTKLCYSYIVDVRKASQTQKSYLQEISILMDVLLRLDNTLRNDKTQSALPSPCPETLSEAVISDCEATLKAHKRALEKHINSFVWPLKDKELRKSIDALHRFRTLVSDIVLADISSVFNEKKKNVDNLSRLVL